MKNLAVCFKRLPMILLHPACYFASETGLWLDGTVVAALLFIVTFFTKLVIGIGIGEATLSSLLNTLMAWTGFFAVYYLVVTIFKKQTNLTDLFGAAGSAGLPLLLTALVLLLLDLVMPLVGISVNSAALTLFGNVLTWLGVAFSWPGWMAYCIFKYRLQLPGKWPILLPAVMMAILIAAWVPALF